MSREDDILASLLALLPPGDALPDGDDSNFAKLLRVTARALDRLEERAEFVLSEIFPSQTTLFLEDHEADLGLPDCVGVAQSTAERKLSVIEKYTRIGSLNKQELIDAAAGMGFDLSITEHFPYPPDSDGSPLGDAHIFDVVLDSLEVTYFRVGTSRTGDSLGSFGDPILICLLDTRKPAHLNYRLTVP